MASANISPRPSFSLDKAISPTSSFKSPPGQYDSRTATSSTKPISQQSPQSSTTSAIPLEARHQRFVLSDPVAFSYLEEDPTTMVLERSRDLEGYQTYVVENWACSRAHPTFVISAFTGDSSHKIKVGVLSVPADEESWSSRLRVYFKTLAQYYARRKDTPLGALMVTNLSTFPSSLTIVLVPDGDLHKHREDFFVSENLKRLGCSGRVGLSIAPPTIPTQVKFHQLYRVSDKIDFYSAVVELVKLCQVALTLFGFLGPEYCDGLLCDVTERAVNDWWLRIGTDLYNVEPSDGVLGHTTVSGILGTLIGARNRLNACGAPIAKDVFDVETTKRAISSFQKVQRLPRTRRLDRTTLDRLHKITEKQAKGDGWGVPRAVKSTVAELSGKGGEMFMEIVGKGEKASMAEIETTDIDRFSQLVKGERPRWLWQGKSRKRTTRDLFDKKPELKSYDQRHAKRPETSEDTHDMKSKIEKDDQAKQVTILPHREDNGPRQSLDIVRLEARDTAFHKTKSRLIGAVGLRGHNRDGPRDGPLSYHTRENKSAESLGSGQEEPSPRYSEYLPSRHAERPEADHRIRPKFIEALTSTPTDSLAGPSAEILIELGAPFEHSDDLSDRTTAARPVSSTASVIDDLEHVLPDGDRAMPHIGRLLRRTQSSSPPIPQSPREVHPAFWPRQLSFSIAEDSIHSYRDLESSAETSDERQQASPKVALKRDLMRAEHARQSRARIATLESRTAHRVAWAVAEVEHFDTLAAQDVEQLHSIYYPRRDDYQALLDGSREVVTEERSRLHEGMKEVETLSAQLEYEISTLRDKVEDVEGAIDEFEKQVKYIEVRVDDLEGSTSSNHGWLNWARKKVFGPERTLFVLT